MTSAAVSTVCASCCCKCIGCLAVVVLLFAALFGSRPGMEQETAEFMSMVRQSRYPVEMHIATADDGVELTMFRIPRPGGHPVLLQHGLLDSAWMWVVSKEFAPAAFQLYDAGYDVWLGNNRGNRFSLGTAAQSSGFWNFSFDDMGRLDVPAEIRTVLEKTGKTGLSFVGHAQGASQFLVAAQDSLCGNSVQDNVDFFVALSPDAYLGHTSSYALESLLEFANFIQTFPSGTQTALASDNVLDAEHDLCIVPGGELCKLAMAAVFGSGGLDSAASISAYLKHFPAGTSAKDMLHFSQLVKSQQFQRFDYGTSGNEACYGSQNPAAYDLSKLAVPTALFFGQSDAWVTPKDAHRLLDQLRPETLVSQKFFPKFSHTTWQIGSKEAGYWISDLLDQLQQNVRRPTSTSAAPASTSAFPTRKPPTSPVPRTEAPTIASPTAQPKAATQPGPRISTPPPSAITSLSPRPRISTPPSAMPPLSPAFRIGVFSIAAVALLLTGALFKRIWQTHSAMVESQFQERMIVIDSPGLSVEERCKAYMAVPPPESNFEEPLLSTRERNYKLEPLTLEEYAAAYAAIPWSPTDEAAATADKLFSNVPDVEADAS
eukprot:TRINITY_DN74593_c0_g1_i1.p1 TRINITY_DN74593_c0_g1~~TRINITY_DN74593_c0_g1_i1.p1  ORF type:complete len:602 (-),score=109.28 TRINITY_DN74593_c0_g1_i1:279-2084(-)